MSRNKGNAAEREVAKLLQAWWRQIEPKAEFVRTPLSGGWGTSTTRAGFKASGDLMTTADRFPFTVEVKRREAWSVHRLLSGSKSPVWGWWRQAQVQGEEMSAIPMLWVRQNRGLWRVIVPAEVGTVIRSIGHPEEVTEWMPWELDGIDFGDLTPVMVDGAFLLSVDPGIFATKKTRGKK